MVGRVHRQSRDTETLVPGHVSQDSDGTSYESGTEIKEAQYFDSLPQRPKLRSLQAKQDYEGSLQKTHWRSSTRAEKFDDLITADHKVHNEESETRNNLRHAVVVQDLATQWIQSYPCKTKTSQETEKCSRKFLESSEKSKVIYTDNSLEFAKSFEDLSWNHRTSTPHRSETNGHC